MPDFLQVAARLDGGGESKDTFEWLQPLIDVEITPRQKFSPDSVSLALLARPTDAVAARNGLLLSSQVGAAFLNGFYLVIRCGREALCAETERFAGAGRNC